MKMNCSHLSLFVLGTGNVNDDERPLDEDVDLESALEKHVFDMNVVMMRAIITAVVSPKNAVTSKTKKMSIFYTVTKHNSVMKCTTVKYN